MAFGPKQVFTATITSGASNSTVIDFGNAGHRNWVIKPSNMGDVFTVYGAALTTDTYRPATSFTVATAMSNAWSLMDALPFRYIKFNCPTNVSDGSTITVIAQG
jgi:hypothetical protein